MTETKELKCPQCGSDEISKPRVSQRAFAISLLLLGFPLPFLSKIYHCYNCGFDFKKRDIGIAKTNNLISNEVDEEPVDD